VDKLRAELNSATSTISQSVGNNAAVLRQRESELREAVAAQKTKVLELNRARDELGVLLKELDSAQRAYDAASQRFSQTRIEAHSEQSDISVLNPAVAPLAPSGPRVLLNTLISILLGTILGVGIALLLELLNRPIRSASDMKDMLGIPVLGTIEWKPPRGRAGGLRHLMAPRRLLRLN
ncbi:MAG TPA: GNVR domain-containing protein, partial [Telluria sp.]|nr:GNVR domain-containing protein [Telluria sp.]